MSNDTACYAFIDVETTGLDSLRNCVITLSAFVTDASYNILGEHHGCVRPDGKKDIVWSMDAEKVHGITWNEAMEYPELDASSEAFMQFIEQYPPLTFVAHNASFDKRMIHGMLSKTDRQFRFYTAFKEFHDTVKMVKDAGLVGSKSKSLGAVCKELEIEHDHHNAKSDAFVLIEIHKRCMIPRNDEFINEIQDRTLELTNGDIE